MTCGIYLLRFKGTDRVYIGQSVNIEKRIRQHYNNLRKQKATYKLNEAFSLYGLPDYEILLECSIEELDDSEEEAISIFNSVDNGFNIYRDTNEAPTYNGYGYGNSKYSQTQILEVIRLLLEGTFIYTEIEEVTGVKSATICTLANCSSHPWVWELYPEFKTKLLSLSDTRKSLGHSFVSDKLSAKNRGINYPSIKSPAGEVFIVDNAYKFAKERGLAPNHFQEVLNGHRKSHKGWKIV